MTKAVFTASENSAYEDLKEHWYHFPTTYLNKVQETIGDLAIFYEPRRSNGRDRSAGALSYYAVARIIGIRKDPNSTTHFFADLAEYIEFERRVPFKVEGRHLEAALRKPDGSNNMGAFRRSVRHVPEEEFLAIVRLGLAESIAEAAQSINQEGRSALLPEEPTVERLTATAMITRKVRAIAFRHNVRSAYSNTCAFTGLKLIDVFNRPEVQAAHIRSVECDGPDSVRNGIAMTGTVHWLFDHGLISVSDDYRILRAAEYVEALAKIPLREYILLPRGDSDRPHPMHLQWHRNERFLSRC